MLVDSCDNDLSQSVSNNDVLIQLTQMDVTISGLSTCSDIQNKFPVNEGWSNPFLPLMSRAPEKRAKRGEASITSMRCKQNP